MKIPQKTTSGVVGALMGFVGGQQYYADELSEAEIAKERAQKIEQQLYPSVTPGIHPATVIKDEN